MKKNFSVITALAVIGSIFLSGCQSTITPIITGTPLDPTGQYLARLDLNAIMDRGSDYAAIASAQVKDAAVLQNLEEKYKNVDRGRVLAEVFKRLTANAKTEIEKERAVLYFAQKISVHDFTNPLMGMPIFDPLILFEINAMDCQKVSRMIADIYAAAGYESRVVDMYGHMVAEVKYDGGWHYADADMFGGGQIVTLADGHIPSMAELSAAYQLLDQMQIYLENEVLFSYQTSGNKGGRSNVPWIYPSYAYFSKKNYARNPGYPYYLYKLNQKPANDGQLFYGWDESKGHVKREHAADIVLSDINEVYAPNRPAITGVIVSGSSVQISYANDSQSDVTRYQIFVSKTSRGWDYGSFKGDAVSKQYWANPGGWKPEQYEQLFKLPAGEVTQLDKPDSTAVLQNLAKGRYYLSVMAVDRYGASLGKKLYPLSNELVIEING